MCAIVGWKGFITPNILRTMIREASHYGPHSTGLIHDGNGGLTVFKRAIHPYLFIRNHNHRIDRAAEVGRMGVVHTRYATHGQVIDANAHPFCHANRWFVHNGVIGNYRQILPTAIVDSECLGPLIEKQAVGRASGSVGLAWVEQTPEKCWKLMVYRHSQGLEAVNVTTTMGLLTIVASRRCILEAILTEVDHDLQILEDPTYIDLVEGTAYHVTPDGLEAEWTNETIGYGYQRPTVNSTGRYIGG